MSSILDALRKLEDAETRSARGTGPPVRQPRPWGALLVGAAIAFVAGAGVTLWLRGGRTPAVETAAAPAPAPPPTAAVDVAATRPAEPAPPPPAATAPVPTAAPAPPAESAPAAAPAVPAELPPAAPAPPPAADAEPPRGHVVVPAAAPPATARAPEVAAVEPRLAPSPPEVEPAPAEEPPPPASDLDVLPRLPADAPHVQVNVLLYSRVPERRSVSLSVDGGSMVTLHEGETAANVEVARILADRIHVRYGGRLFAVQARD